MSNSNVIYKNKGETFKCSFDIDGASSGDVKVRLCLEFNDNKNMFFNGKIDKKGNCVINIPKLTEIDEKQGNLRIEAIIDDTYFNLYESPVELKNSVQMKIKESSGTLFNNSASSSGVRIQFGSLEKESAPIVNEEEEPEVEVEEKIVEVQEPKPLFKPKEDRVLYRNTPNPYINEELSPVVNNNNAEKKKSKLNSFDDFWKNKVKK